MIKKHWKTLLLTSIIILLPLVWMCINYDSLPEQIPVHFNIHGEVDRYGDKTTILGIPIVLFLAHWAMVIEAHFRDKKKPFTAPYVKMISWTLAAASVLLGICLYSSAMGNLLTAQRLFPLGIGFMFIVTGNLMPKLTKNRFAGLRVKWTLADSDIWFKTHRLAGKVSITCGFVIMCLALIKNAAIVFPIMAGLLIVIIAVPIVYSYNLYKKKVKIDGNTEE